MFEEFWTEILKDAIVSSVQEEVVKENIVDIVVKVSNDPRVQSSPINVGLSKLVLFTGGLFLIKAGQIVVSLFPRGRGPRGGSGENRRGNDTENEGATETTRTQ
ncbi:hypothetical protein OROGR_005898 [Orobanche gracilis]